MTNIGFTIQERQAILVLAGAVFQHPEKFSMLIERGIPPQILVAGILELVLADKKVHLELVTACVEIMKGAKNHEQHELMEENERLPQP